MIKNVIDIPVNEAEIISHSAADECPVGCDTPCENCAHTPDVKFMCVDCKIEPVGWAHGTCNGCFDKFLNENQP